MLLMWLRLTIPFIVFITVWYYHKTHLRCNGSHYVANTASCCSGYRYCTTSFNKASTQALRRLKSCSQCVGDSRWWGSLTMVPDGNKAECLSSVNHTAKTIHHHLNLFLIHEILHIFWKNQKEFVGHTCWQFKRLVSVIFQQWIHFTEIIQVFHSFKIFSPSI